MTVDDYLAQATPEVQALIQALRNRVKKILPDVEERVYPGWQIIGFRVHQGKRGAHMGYVAAHKDFATIGFQHGAILPDPTGVLEDENLKQVRFVTIRRVEDVDNPALASLIEHAADIALMPKAMRDSLRF
jgi:hypothetical protein